MADKQKKAAEVGVRLVVDSNAEEEAEHVKKGLAGIHQAVVKKAKAIKGAFADSFSMKAVGVLASGVGMVAGTALAAAGAMAGLGAASAHAFMESEEQVRGLAGTMTLIDQKGNAFEDLVEYSSEVKDSLEDLAIAAGETDDAMVAAFNDVIERGGKSVDEAKNLVEQMAYAGRAIPGGAESLAAGFEQLQMGMIRAKNPLVQLIASTHTMEGSAKDVAKAMQKMSVDEQMEVAEKAIGRMSEKMKDAPMTISQMRKSMGVAIGNLFEGAGEPIVASLSPVVAKVRSLFLDNGSALQRGAKAFGDQMARGIDMVLPMIDAIEKAIAANWGDIQKVIDALYGSSKEAFDYLFKNKEAVGKTIADAATMLIKAAGFIASSLDAQRRALSAFLGKIVDAGAALGIGAFKEMKQFRIDETRTEASEKLRAGVQQNVSGNALSLARVDELRGTFVKEMMDAGASAEDAEKAFTASMSRATDDHKAVMDQVEKFRAGSIYGDAQSFANAWKIASASNDAGAREYVASFLASNRELVKTMVDKGPEILGNGFGELVKQLEGMHSSIADDLKSRRPDLGITAKGITQNFNGGIQIKQDFRDQDPDRIITAFREDLARAGTSRIAAGFGSGLGF